MDQMYTSAGFNGYVSKPMDAAQLARELYRNLPAALIVE